MRSQEIVIEFFGVARHQAGTAQLVVHAGTVAEALTAVQEACPRLPQLIGPRGEISPHYLLSLGGQSFVAEPARRLPPGTRLLVLSADSGG